MSVVVVRKVARDTRRSAWALAADVVVVAVVVGVGRCRCYRRCLWTDSQPTGRSGTGCPVCNRSVGMVGKLRISGEKQRTFEAVKSASARKRCSNDSGLGREWKVYEAVK